MASFLTQNVRVLKMQRNDHQLREYVTLLGLMYCELLYNTKPTASAALLSSVSSGSQISTLVDQSPNSYSLHLSRYPRTLNLYMPHIVSSSSLIRYPIRINNRSNPLIRCSPRKPTAIPTTPHTAIPTRTPITHWTHPKFIRIWIWSQNRPRHRTRRLRMIDIGVHV
jgi:hypothetical protein